MIKHYSIFILSLLLSVTAYAQQDPLQIQFSSIGDPMSGSTYDVDVRVSDFDQLSGAQFIIGWDSTILEIDTLPFVTSDLSDFNSSVISLPSQTASMIKGRLRLSWFTATAQSLPDDHLLFTMRFNVIGTACDSTDIILTETPPNFLIEIIGQNDENIGAEANTLNARIPGTNCGGGGTIIGDEVGLIFPHVIASPGESICLPFTTVNFDSIETFQGSLMWDPTIIQYSTVQNFSLPNMSVGSFNANNVSNGTISFVWFDNTGITPASISDNGTIFELCFDVIGNLGDCSPVKAFDGTPSIQISSPSPVGIRPFVVVEGSVCIEEDVEGQEFGIKADTVVVDINEGEVCVDFSTINFNDIAGMQYTLQWDQTVLTYNRVEAVVPSFSSTFNPAGMDRLRYSWTNPKGEGLDLADGTIIYRVCFAIIGDCEDSTALSFISEPGRPIEITDGTFNSLPSSLVSMQNGLVTIECGIKLDADINDVRCNGDLNGSINLNISGGLEPYSGEWSWDNGNGSDTFSGVTISTLLLGQSAGTYLVTVTDSNGDSVTDTYVIEEPDPIVIEVDVNGNAVSIEVTGGNGNDTIEINPEIDSFDNVPDGTYTVLVTDGRGCTETEIFVVGPVCDNPVDVTAIVFSAICGDDGRIETNCTGGSGIYNVTSNPALTLNGNAFINVPVGTYEITCTDQSNPACVDMVTVEVLQGSPAALELSITNITNVGCSGDGGGFVATASGGCEPYSINYSVDGANPVDYIPGAEYPAGDYIVVVEDNEGNIDTEEFSIIVDASGELMLEVTTTPSPCTGMMGSALFKVTGTCGSITCSVLLNGTTEQACDLIDNGDTTFTGNFPVGTHSITFTDDFMNTIVSTSFTISLSQNVLKANVASVGNGAIDINVLGGVMPFQFFWTDPDGNDAGNTEDLTGLILPGMYSVTIIDAIGCSFALTVTLPQGGNDLTLTLDPLALLFDGFATPCAEGNCMGAISGLASGGTPPYTIILTDDLANDEEFNLGTGASFDIQNLCAGSYLIELRDSDGNSDFGNSSIIITAPDNPQLLIELDQRNCPDEGQNNGSISTFVSGGTELGYIYTWTPANNDPIPGPTIDNIGTGVYTLLVEDSNGCTVEESFDLITDCIGADCFKGKRVITPNNDNKNDFFTISCANSSDYSLQIFDRWGVLVYSTSNYTNDWMGIDLEGNEVPEGAYFWVLDIGQRIYRGTVTLLRD